jgi:predicted dinucleotide-binding enzyme
MKKTFGIIGAGNIGQSIAHHLVKAGYSVILSNSKGPDSLKEIVANLGKGAKAGSLQDAAKADIVVLAIPWLALPSLKTLTNWQDKLVIDATNQYISFNPNKFADLGGKASSEVVAETLKGARIVKAFNTLWFKILASDPEQGGGNRVLLVSGDDTEAKKEVVDLIETLKFAAVDIGSLAHSKIQEQDGLLGHINLIRVEYDVYEK